MGRWLDAEDKAGAVGHTGRSARERLGHDGCGDLWLAGAGTGSMNQAEHRFTCIAALAAKARWIVGFGAALVWLAFGGMEPTSSPSF